LIFKTLDQTCLFTSFTDPNRSVTRKREKESVYLKKWIVEDRKKPINLEQRFNFRVQSQAKKEE
jgi:hypothetical protein